MHTAAAGTRPAVHTGHCRGNRTAATGHGPTGRDAGPDQGARPLAGLRPSSDCIRERPGPAARAGHRTGRDSAPMTGGRRIGHVHVRWRWAPRHAGREVMKILDRCGALTGLAYVVLIIVGSTMSTDASPGPHPDHPTGHQDIGYLHWLPGSTPVS